MTGRRDDVTGRCEMPSLRQLALDAATDFS